MLQAAGELAFGAVEVAPVEGELPQVLQREGPVAGALSDLEGGIMVDALTELGRYPEALTTLQRMVDLNPGVASFTRISDSYELRGDTVGAKEALDRGSVRCRR